ncbi:hypothetical protein HDU98_010166 [Podochytrium sp. JEL0797]|nr:hypothetical protein HDU98_010166 [Podochytrium sp. JEL0797]
MFAGKTKPGAPLMNKVYPSASNGAGKMPVNSYGKVPRVLTPTGTVLVSGGSGGGGGRGGYGDDSGDSDDDY